MLRREPQQLKCNSLSTSSPIVIFRGFLTVATSIEGTKPQYSLPTYQPPSWIPWTSRGPPKDSSRKAHKQEQSPNELEVASNLTAAIVCCSRLFVPISSYLFCFDREGARACEIGKRIGYSRQESAALTILNTSCPFMLTSACDIALDNHRKRPPIEADPPTLAATTPTRSLTIIFTNSKVERRVMSRNAHHRPL